jgi:hypothetical protein
LRRRTATGFALQIHRFASAVDSRQLYQAKAYKRVHAPKSGSREFLTTVAYWWLTTTMQVSRKRTKRWLDCGTARGRGRLFSAHPELVLAIATKIR